MENYAISIQTVLSKTEDFYKDIADDVEKRFDTSIYECNSIECNRLLPTGKN